MRVIHVPTTVGGNPQGISHHLRKLGVESETWVISQNCFGYAADKVLASRSDGFVITELKKIAALRYVFKCDIAFFNYGTGLFTPFVRTNRENDSSFIKVAAMLYRFYSWSFSKVEVGLLKLLGKPIFIQYQGDDARQGDFCLTSFAVTFADRVDKGYYSQLSDDAKRKRIKYYSATAEKIYALNPDLLHVLPRTTEFLPYSHINFDEWMPAYTQTEDRPLRIAHAPSNRAVKGTDLILDAVDALQRAGCAFELVLVEGVSNAKAMEIYRTVDIVIDQLFAGWYGGLAVEAMALGKPVISYIRQDDLKFIPQDMRTELPIIQAEPTTIHEVLERVLNMSREDLLEIATRSRAYVEKWHDPVAIASRIKQDMEAALRG